MPCWPPWPASRKPCCFTTTAARAAPEPDALREAAYFVERLSGDRMPLQGLVVNRATLPDDAALTAYADLGVTRLIALPPREGRRTATAPTVPSRTVRVPTTRQAPGGAATSGSIRPSTPTMGVGSMW